MQSFKQFLKESESLDKSKLIKENDDEDYHLGEDTGRFDKSNNKKQRFDIINGKFYEFGKEINLKYYPYSKYYIYGYIDGYNQ